MKFERLRLAGFKSFCDATDFKIEPGLTGLVGPNGCGKSNLVEALRWVMGESSYKSMRASGMDEVIFSGAGSRPSRNIAEVGLTLDNSDRRAPAAFNDAETIEVTRRIERETGSTYRVNGREVRARDVQLLFADASTGARSPAMVRQGQIGEIIAAKPQARRLILEEAAGVSGLHTRRHEAELRLKGADDNLVRVEDVLKQIDAQIDSLKRQARQSNRYRVLAQDIRRQEALARLIAWRDREAQFILAGQRLDADLREVAERTRAQAEAARLQAIAAADLPPLREEEARVGAALHRLVLARDALAGEEKRARDRVAELERHVAESAQDLQREEALVADAADVLTRLASEDEALSAETARSEDSKREAEARRARLEERLAAAEAALAEAQGAAADLNARRNALAAGLAEEGRRVARFEGECASLARERADLQGAAGDEAALRAESEAARALGEALAAAEAHTLVAEGAHAEAREAEARSRGPLAEAERTAQRLDTEIRTLTKLLGATPGGKWPPVVDAVDVARGYEAALGAALGDDLQASIDAAAPAHWSLLEAGGDPELPAGVEPLAGRVEAPPALRRRLAQIGVVARAEGARLSALLKPGQRLVSLEGDLWRWDGFVSTAEAPTPAAQRLVEKNRLGDLSREAEAARQVAEIARAAATRTQAALREAATAESEARQRARAARVAADTARDKFAAAERRRAQTLSRLSALDEALTRAEGAAATRRPSVSASRKPRSPRWRRATNWRWRWSGRERSPRMSGRNLPRRRRPRRLSPAKPRRARRGAARSPTSDAPGPSVAPRPKRISPTSPSDASPPSRNSRRSPMRPPPSCSSAASCRRSSTRPRPRASGAADARVAAETALAEADRAARAALEAMGAAREARAASEERLEGARNAPR